MANTPKLKFSFAEASRLRIERNHDKQTTLTAQMLELERAFPEFYQELEAWKDAQRQVSFLDEQNVAELNLAEKYTKLDEMLAYVIQKADLDQMDYGCNNVERFSLCNIDTWIPSALYFTFPGSCGVLLYLNAVPGANKDYIALDMGLQVISDEAYRSDVMSTRKLTALSLAHFSNASSRNSSIFKHFRPGAQQLYAELTTLAAGYFQGVRKIMVDTIHDGYRDLFLKEEESKSEQKRSDVVSGTRMKRFAGMMPANEVERSEAFKDQNNQKVRIDAGPNGWTIIWADLSTTYADAPVGTEENFKNAYARAEAEVGKLTSLQETPKEDVER